MKNTKKLLTCLLIITTLLTLISKSNSQYYRSTAPPITLRPLCLSQLALANRACSMIPYTPVTPSSSPPPPAAPAQPPPSPSSPKSPESDSPPPPNEGGSRRHRHHHRHSNHNNNNNSNNDENNDNPAVQECCRWLKEVDTQCVCDLLVRLPVFLAKPVHAYTVQVGPQCSVTYTCPGRMIMP